ncbi:MAG: chemotaxis protein CheB [Planctomycetes bacterium]|nr:chemotaxis protein CheB [Planctomycetota bacterium]
MSGTIRVALIEASTHTRRALASRLSQLAGVEVFWSAPTMAMAIDRLKAPPRPGVLLVDVSSLADGGKEALLAALASLPELPVYLLDPKPGDAVPEGPWAGVVSKPLSGQEPSPDWPAGPLRALLGRAAASRPAPVMPGRKLDVVLIGLSTGGPTALEKLAPEWPGNLAAPILVVQHVMAGFDHSLMETIARRTRLAVSLGREGAPILPGTVTLAPAGRHMVVRPGAVPTIGLDDGPPEQSCKPAVDPLFRSAANVYGGRALAVVLTGMGEDGLRGARLLRERGAAIMAQDEKSSVVWGMPGAIVRAGLADKVVPLGEVSREIVMRAGLSG